MIYSEVVANKQILPKKEKYTMRDVDNALVNSLFNGSETLTLVQAAFIVKCSAIHWDTTYSKAVDKAGKDNPIFI